MKKVVLALVLATLIAMGPVMASPWYGPGGRVAAVGEPPTSQFGNYAAYALARLQGVKAQVVGAIAGTPRNFIPFAVGLASFMYDVQHLTAGIVALLYYGNVKTFPDATEAGLLLALTGATPPKSPGQGNVSDFAEFLAASIYGIQGIKSDVLYLLANSSPGGYYPSFSDAIAGDMVAFLKIVGRVLVDLYNTTNYRAPV